MSKIRTSIPRDLASEVLFASDNICCVCNERGKTLQIHHIDENPSHNSFENLSVLCLECHDKTQIKGGFGRKLNSDLVIKYRDDWLRRVISRRNAADEMAVNRQVGMFGDGACEGDEYHSVLHEHKLKEPPMNYINALPEFRLALLAQAQPSWDTGSTSVVVQASYDYIDSLTGILVALAACYSPIQFGFESPQKYFSEIIASRFRWHRTISEPHGFGTGGAIVNITCSGGVISDVEKMIEDMVINLVGYDDTFDWRNWPKRWRNES